MKDIKIGFFIMCLITAVFIAVSCFLPYKSQWFGNEEWHEYLEGWQYIKVDGSQAPTEIPCHLSGSPKDSTVIWNTLPEVEDGQVIALYSHLQDVKVYIDDREVMDYSNADVRKFGKETPSAWILVKLNEDDSYKPIRILFNSFSEKHQNLIHKIYFGNETGIVFHIWQQNIMTYILGIIIIALGVTFILFSFILGLSEKNASALRQILYLGTFCILMGTWFLCVSKARQFYAENIFFLHNMSYILLMILPIPLLAYVGEVERNKERKVLHVLEGLFCINFILCMLLAVTNVHSFVQTFELTHILLIISLGFVLFTLIKMFICRRRDRVLFMTGSIVLISWIGFGMILHLFGVCHNLTLILSQGVSLFVLITGIGASIELSEEHRHRNKVVAESEAKARFLANLSHELRTPMYAISGMADLLSESELSWDNENRVNMIRQSTESMLSIINDIMDASKMENSESKIVESEYELLPILQELMELTRYRIGEKVVELKCSLRGEVPSAYYGDKEKVRQILNNLLDRSAKYTYEGSIELVVSFEVAGSRTGNLCLQITDTGIGIEKKEMGNPEENSLENGFELGLINCQKMIQKINGSMDITISEDSGNKIDISIPQLIMNETPILETQIEEGEKKPSVCSLKSIKAPDSKILVVDDNRVNLQVAQAMLRRYEGEVIMADSGLKALDILHEQHDIDLVFMDIMMPEMDGYETVKRIRTQCKKFYKRLPVVALTANAVGDTEERALEAGMDAYMVKPVHTSELDEILKIYLPSEKQVPIDAKEGTETKESARVHMQYQEFLYKLHGIHVAEGLGYCMNKPEVYYAVLKAFATPQLKHLIADAWDKKDIKDYTIYAHSIKSSARNIGADHLSDMAYDLEKAAKNKDIGYLEKHHMSCMEEYDKVYKIVEEALSCMEQKKTDRSQKTRKLSAEELNNFQMRLIDALKNMDPVGSKEILKEMADVDFEQKEMIDGIEKINDYVDNFDFEEAEAALEQMLH